MNQLEGSTIWYTGSFFSIILVAVFLDNTVLTHALGMSSMLKVIQKKRDYTLFCMIITVITILASLVVYFINPLFGSGPVSYYIKPFVYVLVISIFYIAALLLISQSSGKNREEFSYMLHISAFNCVILGAMLLANHFTMTLSTAIGFGLGSGIGFYFATILIAEVYPYLNSEEIPKPFRGFPATLIFIGIISMALYGIIGHRLPL